MEVGGASVGEEVGEGAGRDQNITTSSMVHR